MKRIPLEGQRIGRWTVLGKSLSSRGMTRYNCKCKCGTEAVVFAKHLRSGSSRGCHPCSVKRGSRHPQFKGFGEITASWWLSHVGRSVTLHARRPIEVTVTIEEAWALFLAQERRCALSGLLLEFPRAAKQKGTASLDRIDSSKGYEPGNIQWVHKRVNIMKNAVPQTQFIELCHAVAKTCPIK